MSEKKTYPLSHPEKRVWLTEQTFLGTPYFNLAFLVPLPPGIERPRLEAAVNLLLRKNEGLRLRFLPDSPGREGEPCQYVADYAPYALPEEEFSGEGWPGRQAGWVKNRTRALFEIVDSPLYDFVLVRNPEKSALFLKLHHLIADGGTIFLVANALQDYCERLRAGQEVDPSPNPSYIEFVALEEEYLQSGQAEGDRRFWLDKLTPLPELVDLSFRQAAQPGIEAERLLLAVPPETRQALHDFAAGNRSSMFKLVVSAFALYLSRVGRTPDVVVGTVNHNRTTPRTREMTGMFVSTFPLRLTVDEALDFAAFTRYVGQEVDDTVKNRQRYPYDLLVPALRERHQGPVEPLSQVAVIGHGGTYDEFRPEYQDTGCEPTPLNVHLDPDGKDALGRLEFLFDYHPGRFGRSDIEGLFRCLCTILDNGFRCPSAPLSALSMTPGEEARRILAEFQGAPPDYPLELPLHALVEAQAERRPDRTALVFGDRTLAYGRMNAEADRLAGLLLARGLRSEEIVGVLAERSVEAVVALLAVLKAGGAYLPIDPACPVERARFMLEDSGCRFLLAHEHLGRKVAFPGELIALAPPDETERPGPATGVRVSPGQLAYVIYTSGSTGRPKGVMIEHRAAVNLVQWHRRAYGIGEDDVCAEFASFSFDASVSQTFSPLAAGAELHILAPELRSSAELLNAYFEAHGVTYTDLPTQLFEYFMETVGRTSLRRITTGGEKLKKYVPQAYRVYDEYGPTEFTVVATSFLVDRPWERSPIGRPIAGARAYILDPAGRLQPVGVPGELCLAGANLARGYLNRPELTAEKFMDDPFMPGQRMYRTGDLARWLPDGNIDYLGRIDFQVKIRGYRIELPEIESRLRDHKAVREAVVVDRTDASGNAYLCAYFVAARDIPVAELKAFLARSLPDYMIPALFLKLDRMPLNTSGKIDRRALPEPAAGETRLTKYVPPANETQLFLAGLFGELLGCARVGAADGFFELGGHSLKAAILLARLGKRFGVRLSLQDLFDHPTVRELEALVAAAQRTDLPPVVRVREKGPYPLSPAQKRLYFLHLLDRDALAYNVPFLVRIEGNLDRERLHRAIGAFVEKQDVLRTSFALAEGEPVQQVHGRVRLKPRFLEAPEERVGEIMDAFVRPFDLSRAPLLRVCLVRCGEGLHFLLLDFPHIVFDGQSVDLFLADLAAFYLGENLAPLAFRFRDYVGWQRRLLSGGERLARQERFWLAQFQGEAPVLDLAADFPRPKKLSGRGGRIRCEAPAELTDRLRALAHEAQATLSMVLLSAFAIALARFSSQDDVVVGMPCLGRTAPELEPIAGMFVNSLPLRLRPASGKTFAGFLGEVRSLLLAALDNQDYQLDTLLEKLGSERNSGRNPLFDVMFTFASRFARELRFADLTLMREPWEAGTAKFDLTLDAVERPDVVEFEFEYAADLFLPATVERLAAHFLNVLRAVAADPQAVLRDLDSLPPAERRFLLEEYNATAADYPAGRTLAELFEEQAGRTPDRPALEHEGAVVGYAELDRAANRLARLLRTRGAGPGAFVGILMHRRPELVAAVLGVLKAGAAYVPIDPSYPPDRIAWILEDSGMSLLLTEAALAGRAEGPAGRLVWEELDLPAQDPGRLPTAAGPDDPAYMIYTSGSTGKPKGVVLRHRNVVNYIHWAIRVYLEGEALAFSLHSSVSFDLTVTSLFAPLLSGNSLVVYPDTADPVSLVRRIVGEDKAGIVKLTPSHLRILLELDFVNRRLRKLIVGGEDLPADLCRQLADKFEHPVKIFNEYGPTEATVGCMIHLFDPARDRGASVPIGVPGANASVYLLDGDLNPVPFGAKGEMFVGGAGVALGYRNRPEMTLARFLPSPFRPGDTLYRTGDLGRFLPGGEMEYLGRADTQVKIRGFRIECGEIEQRLLACPGLHAAVVVARKDDRPETYLCAYFESEGEADPARLREFLAGGLPEYMLPSFFVRLDRIPVNENGKVDRKALPPPAGRPATGAAFVGPRNAREQRILEIWQDVLKVEGLGVRDNFFLAGGHSLKAIALVARLQKHFRADLQDIYRFQTVEEQAANLAEETDALRRRLEKLKEAPPAEDPAARPAIRAGMDRYVRSTGDLLGLDLSETKGYGHVLLTGATGFLGGYLLRDLLARPEVRAVTAVVRAPDAAAAGERVRARLARCFGDGPLEGEEKIRVLAGHLEQERFGLDLPVYEELAGSVDAVVHSAALVKHYGPYEEFRLANVESVRRLVDFARTGRPKDIHHVSTLSVGLGEVAGERVVLFSEDQCDMGQKTDNPYLRSKLEAERLLHEARGQGVTASIYRVGNIVYHSETGRPQENLEENVFFALVKAAAVLGVVMEGEEADFSFVDQVSRAILTLFDRPALANGTFHLENPWRADLARVLGDPALGLHVRALPRRAYVDWLERNFQRPAFRDQAELFLLHMDWLSERGDAATQTVRLSGRTRFLLEALGFSWTEVEPSKMRPMLRQAYAGLMEALRATPLFAALDPEALFEAACLARREYFDRDEPLLWEGDRNRDLFLVETGFCEVCKHSREGWLGDLFLAGPDTLLGENALWDEASGVVAEPVFDGVQALRLEAGRLRALAARHPELGLRLARELGRRVETLQKFVVSME